MTLTNVPESTKQLWTLKLNISNDNKNGAQSEFTSSMQSVLNTNERMPGELLDPLFEEVAWLVKVSPSARRRMSR